MKYSPSIWYWIVGGGSIYSSASGSIISLPDDGYTAWQAAGGAPTPVPSFAVLDEVLTSAGLPASGQVFSSVQSSLISAASSTCSAVIVSVAPDQAHLTAFLSCANIVRGCGNAAPTSSDPSYASFNSLASAYNLTPAQLASTSLAVEKANVDLSVALLALEASVAAASNQSGLQTALSTFETSISSIVTEINAVVPIQIAAPAAISVKGVNA